MHAMPSSFLFPIALWHLVRRRFTRMRATALAMFATLCTSLSVMPSGHAANLHVVDDAGQTIQLTHPARRIISIAPHVTELLFAAGGGDRIVGTVEYSDYPEAAQRIPRVGDNKALDLERIVALRPDLLVVWRHGNLQQQIDKLRQLGLPIFMSEPLTLAQIPDSIERLGTLMGTSTTAHANAEALRSRLANLQTQYANRPRVTVFYQVWQQPLMTLNGTHLISSLITLCGGVNVFAAQAPLVPTISPEAVLTANPEVMLTASMGKTQKRDGVSDLEMWRRWATLTAVARDNLYGINGDLLNRSGPRIVDAAEQLCSQLENARRKRPVRPLLPTGIGSIKSPQD